MHNTAVVYIYMIVGVEIENWSCDPYHVFLLGLDIAYLCTKFDKSPASIILKIWLVSTKIEMVHVT